MARPRKPPRIGRRADRDGWWIFDGTTRISAETEDRQSAERFLAQYLTARDAVGDAPCVADILDKRLVDLQDSGKARASNTVYYHDALKSHFGPLQPEEITGPYIKQYWAKRRATPTSLREELLELRVALNWACRQGWIPEPPYIEVPNKRPPRERFLTRDEARQLLDAAKTLHFRLFLLLAMTTGHRKGAILGLTWDRVDLERGLIDLTDPERYETKKRRTVAPVGPEIVAALRDARPWKDDECPNVIQYHGKPIKDIKHAFRDAATEAGIPWATPHVLKHSVISWMAEDGDDVETISDLTATHPNTVRRVYRKFSPDRLRTSAERLSKIASLRPWGRKPPAENTEAG